MLVLLSAVVHDGASGQVTPFQILDEP